MLQTEKINELHYLKHHIYIVCHKICTKSSMIGFKSSDTKVLSRVLNVTMDVFPYLSSFVDSQPAPIHWPNDD